MTVAHKCLFCEDTYTKQDLAELDEMGEKYHLESDYEPFVCPDCFDDFQRLPLEEQLKALSEGVDYDWTKESDGDEKDAR